MKDFEIISELNRLAGIYGYGGNVPKFTDDHWNAIFAAKQRIKDYALLTSKVKQLSRAVEKYKDEVDEQKAIAELEHATQMEWFRQACEYAAESRRLTAENAELRARLEKAVDLPYMYEAEVVDSAGHFLKTIYVVVYNNNGTIQAIQYSYKKVAEARLKEIHGGEI